MNKVININFQGRVIPIEEPAYEELKKYVESLRSHFANEEGREEIINDIENRIAELFSEKLKAAGTNFISESHVAAIIASIGRPEQFEELSIDDSAKSNTSSGNSGEKKPYTEYPSSRGSLYRNENDKMLGGVCSGIGAYLKIDTTLVRVLFALLAVGAFGTGLVLYIVLWAILPSRYLNPIAVTRKLYRDPEQKVIGGVCSGIAHYFNIAVWIPRLIFVVPLVVGILKLPFAILFIPFAASISGTMFFIYIILWIVVPKAVTASERLEMKGQRVDLESIKNKVQDEMQGVKKHVSENAAAWKNNIETKVNEWGKEVNESAAGFAGQAGPAARKSGNAFVRFVVGIFKVFIFFVLGIISISLFAALIGLVAGANVLMPLRGFIVEGEALHWYAWGTLILFIIVPIIGIIQWLVRSIIGHKTKSNVIGITLGSLWTLGWVAVVMLVATVSKQFKRPGSIQNEVAIAQPSTGKLKIDFREPEGNYYPLDLDWDSDFDFRRDVDGIMLSRNEDSLLLSNIRVKLEKSRDDQFHVTVIKRARAESPIAAEGYAEQISYTITQQDSLLSLPLAFPITQTTHFRNQQVLVEIQVPVGKEIYIDDKADQLSWYSVKSGTRGLNISIDHDYDEEDSWRTGVWYIMQEGGIEKKYKDAETREESMERLEKSIREKIREENMKVEEMKIDITPNGDTTIDVSVKDIALLDEKEHQDDASASSARPLRKLLFGAFNLLKMGH
jgi:phage shock protein PspC (stress-responsive transcriptional regulator)